MSQLLTAPEYAALAEMIALPSQAFIDGAFVPSVSGRTFDTRNPATGQVLAEIAACDERDVDIAVARAKAAFADGRWHRRTPAARKGPCCASPTCSNSMRTSWR